MDYNFKKNYSKKVEYNQVKSIGYPDSSISGGKEYLQVRPRLRPILSETHAGRITLRLSRFGYGYPGAGAVRCRLPSGYDALLGMTEDDATGLWFLAS